MDSKSTIKILAVSSKNEQGKRVGIYGQELLPGMPGQILIDAHGDLWRITEGDLLGVFLEYLDMETGAWTAATAPVKTVYDALNVIVDDNPHPGV